MMNLLAPFLSVVGLVASFFGFCFALFCGQAWVLWLTGCGVTLMVAGQVMNAVQDSKKNWYW